MTEPNPYSVPEADLSRAPDSAWTPGTGSFQITTAIAQAWSATASNFFLLLLAMLVIFGLIVMSALTLIGYFFVVPALLWGGIKLWLNAFDGRGALGDCFSGFSDYLRVTGRMLGLILVSIALSLLTNSVGLAGTALDRPGLQAAGGVVNLLLVLAIFPRLYFAYFYVVERDMGPIEAISASWEATSSQKLRAVLLLLTSSVIVILGALALGVGLLWAIPMAYFLYVSAYRQTAGGPADPTE